MPSESSDDVVKSYFDAFETEEESDSFEMLHILISRCSFFS